ncbi:MAG: hypothetical protein Q7K45_06795 [Nanoarchaeota archaeon]|nr:hypothetical protein [Nanoarchaeota archaeon]
MVKNAVEFHLYQFCKTLSNRIPDENDRASIFMYALMQGLLDFQPTSKSTEEIKFQEVKAGYNGLEKAVQLCRSSGVELVPGYIALSECKAEVDPRLQHYFTSQNKEMGQSILLHNLMNELAQRPKSYEDRLRRKGIELIESIYARGLLQGRREALLADYTLLETYMGGDSR